MHHWFYFTEAEPVKMVMMTSVSTCLIKLRAGIGPVNIHHITQWHAEPPLETII